MSARKVAAAIIAPISESAVRRSIFVSERSSDVIATIIPLVEHARFV
jgi:hypothetical protein